MNNLDELIDYKIIKKTKFQSILIKKLKINPNLRHMLILVLKNYFNKISAFKFDNKNNHHIFDTRIKCIILNLTWN